MVSWSSAWSKARTLATRGLSPTADDREAVRRTSLVIYIVVVAGLSPVWGIAYLALGRPVSAAIPLAYMTLSVATLAWSWRTGDFGIVPRTQVVAILVLPMALQWSLGGFVHGSAVALWSFTATMVGLAFYGTRTAAAMFGAFAVAVVVSGLAEPALAAAVPPLPTGVTTAFIVLNIAAPLGVTTAVLLYVSQQRELAARRSEELLLNILPASVAARLRRGEDRIADRFDEATVLFADIAGFTPFADRTSPDVLVGLLDRAYSALDELVERHGLEKIKTVGDAYMVVGGVPVPRADHVEAVAELALAIAPTLRAALGDAWPGLQLRIGVATGPVAAGVIGRRRLAYGVWGDTVNLASRMESLGVPGAIQVTERVYTRLRERYRFEVRGEIEVKGKGPMPTYLLRAPDGSTTGADTPAGDAVLAAAVVEPAVGEPAGESGGEPAPEAAFEPDREPAPEAAVEPDRESAPGPVGEPAEVPLRSLLIARSATLPVESDGGIDPAALFGWAARLSRDEISQLGRALDELIADGAPTNLSRGFGITWQAGARPAERDFEPLFRAFTELEVTVCSVIAGYDLRAAPRSTRPGVLAGVIATLLPPSDTRAAEAGAILERAGEPAQRGLVAMWNTWAALRYRDGIPAPLFGLLTAPWVRVVGRLPEP